VIVKGRARQFRRFDNLIDGDVIKGSFLRKLLRHLDNTRFGGTFTAVFCVISHVL